MTLTRTPAVTTAKKLTSLAALALGLSLGLSGCATEAERPSKNEVLEDVREAFHERLDGIDLSAVKGAEETVREAASCLVDGLGDRLSVEQLKALIQGGVNVEDLGISREDAEAFAAAKKECLNGILP